MDLERLEALLKELSSGSELGIRLEYGLPPCGCGSKAGKSAGATFRKGAEHELTQSDLDGIAEATTRATVELLRGGGGDDDDASQSSAKLALRKGPVGSPLWRREKDRIDGIRLRARAADEHAEAQSIAIQHGTAAVVRFALGGGAW